MRELCALNNYSHRTALFGKLPYLVILTLFMYLTYHGYELINNSLFFVYKIN